MAETLLTPSSIKLFGRKVSGITFDPSTLGTGSYLGGDNFLRRQLSGGNIITSGHVTAANANIPVNLPLDVGTSLASTSSATNYLNVSDGDSGGTVIEEGSNCYVSVAGGVVSLVLNDAAWALKNAKNTPIILQAGFPPNLARIYAFSFEGAFYQLARPAIFLVHGLGTPVGDWFNPSTLDQVGVAAREWDFSGNSSLSVPYGSPQDICCWEYEKGDFSLRLDLDAGPFEQILLQAALRGGAGVSGAGVSGAGVSGAGVSGAGVSGAGVSGAGVSGAGVSGAGVSGAGVSGAGVRR
jgi:hypothetical protein